MPVATGGRWPGVGSRRCRCGTRRSPRRRPPARKRRRSGAAIQDLNGSASWMKSKKLCGAPSLRYMSSSGGRPRRAGPRRTRGHRRARLHPAPDAGGQGTQCVERDRAAGRVLPAARRPGRHRAAPCSWPSSRKSGPPCSAAPAATPARRDAVVVEGSGEPVHRPLAGVGATVVSSSASSCRLRARLRPRTYPAPGRPDGPSRGPLWPRRRAPSARRATTRAGPRGQPSQLDFLPGAVKGAQVVKWHLGTPRLRPRPCSAQAAEGDPAAEPAHGQEENDDRRHRGND